MIRFLSIILALIATPLFSQEEVVVDLSQNRISITANFSGSEIFVFGAVKRNGALAEGVAPLDVAIVVEGPLVETTVRKKEKVFGIWINTESVQVDAAPSFFTVATTRPLNDILNEGDLRDYAIGVEHAVRPQAQSEDGVDIESFSKAVARIRLDDGLYSEREGIVNLTSETLFNTSIQLPANLVEGDYTARIYLIRDRNIVADTSVEISVRKVGLERWLYNLAHEQALIYALLSLAVALLAGYGASAFFRLIKR
jgi:uncharacterized protein (TIGR02186 family)